ncbi:hypothetical protein ABK040_011631 [Willaertia magna]
MGEDETTVNNAEEELMLLNEDQSVVGDIQTNWAVKELDKIELSHEEYGYFKEKGLELENLLIETKEKEIQATEQGKLLNRELLEEKKKLKEIERIKQENQQYIADLKRDLMKAENQTALMNETESISQNSVSELERKIAILEDQKNTLIEQQNSKEKPIMEQYKANIKQLKSNIREVQERKKREEERKIKYEQDNQQLRDEIEVNLKKRIKDLEKTLERLRGDPERERRQTEIVKKASKASHDEVKNLNDKLEILDNEVREIETKKIDFEQIHYNMFMLEDSAKINASKIQGEIDKTKSQLQQEKEKEKTEMVERVNVNSLLKTTAEQESQEIKQKTKLENEENTINKEAYNAQVQVEHIKSIIEKLVKTRDELLVEKNALQEELEKTKEEKIELEKDVDLLINELLTEENEYTFLIQKLKNRRKETTELESKITELNEQESEMDKIITNLEAIREKKARDAATQKRNFMDAVGEIKILQFSNGELQRSLNEIENKYTLLQQAYSLMERERNKNAKAIQDNAQSHSEIREKNKILDNELEVLTRQSQKKDEHLKKEKREEEKENRTKGSLESLKAKKKLEKKKKEEQNIEKNKEIEKLNADIDLAESLMLDLKMQYESGVRDRNYTGFQLIDRNDELCILNEKANMNENMIKNGEIERMKRDEEIRALKLDLEEQNRTLQILFKELPEYQSLLKLEEELTQEIEKCVQIAQKLSEELEKPENEERWRKLEGNIPSEEELKDKIQELEEKLNNRREQLMEKDLVLKGITKSSDKLRKLAIKGREESFDLAVNINLIQKQIEQTTTKMKATVSELSIYGTKSMRLEKENEELQTLIGEARERMDRGEPPTPEMEKEWIREEELKERWKVAIEERRRRMEFENSLPPTITRTTAPKRPNAYIPDDDLGIPKPYLMPPVMYSAPSANMRHIKKPKPKEIII